MGSAIMNAREGFRRVGLLLGALGAIMGCIYSVVLWNDDRLLDRRARAEMFEAVHQAMAAVKNPSSDTSAEKRRRDVWDRYRIRGLDLSAAGEVLSVDTADATIYAETAPAWWEYLVLLLPPVLGFILPWGTIRVLVWVGRGFFQSSR
jgi:hypothetical protein